MKSNMDAMLKISLYSALIYLAKFMQNIDNTSTTIIDEIERTFFFNA